MNQKMTIKAEPNQVFESVISSIFIDVMRYKYPFIVLFA